MSENQNPDRRSIAVLGTSPLMIILADHLARAHQVSIFEERPVFGGAWSQVVVDGLRISSKTNIVVPLDLEEEPVMDRINTVLRQRFGIEAAISDDNISMLSGYNPQNRFHYDLSPLFSRAKNAENLLEGRVESVSAHDGIVTMGGRTFDMAFLPYFMGIDGIEVDGHMLMTPYSEIVSEHLLLVLEGDVTSGALYCEEFNDTFDRVQIREQMGRVIFTGRVGREHKGKPLDWLAREGSSLFPGARVLHASIDKYRNCYRDEQQLQALRAAVEAAPQLQLVNTSQFVSGFRALLPILGDEAGHG